MIWHEISDAPFGSSLGPALNVSIFSGIGMKAFLIVFVCFQELVGV